MASACRSAAIAAARSTIFRSKSALPKPFSLPSRRAVPLISRSMSAVVGNVESLMPLHSAIAAARLQSCIAEGSSRWSWLSQGYAMPL